MKVVHKIHNMLGHHTSRRISPYVCLLLLRWENMLNVFKWEFLPIDSWEYNYQNVYQEQQWYQITTNIDMILHKV